jgi:peptide/nickel transport system substrate-binding protein
VGGWVFNNERDLFRNNAPLRKAINYLIDRRAMKEQLGVLSGERTDQLLSTKMPGFRNAPIYPLSRPNFTKAKRLARGHTRSGRAIILAANFTSGAQNRALILQAQLRAIGIDASIETDNPLNPRIRTRGASWDIADFVTVAPYADPSSALAPLLDGRLITDKGNTNVAYFNKAWVNRRLDAAAKLTGRARLRAYGRLDIDVMRREAPTAPYTTFAWDAFVSNRVGCVLLHPIFQISWGSICRRRG